MGTFLQTTKRGSSNSYNYSPSASTTIVSRLAGQLYLKKSAAGQQSLSSLHMFHKWMEATLIYTEPPTYYVWYSRGGWTHYLCT